MIFFSLSLCDKPDRVQFDKIKEFVEIMEVTMEGSNVKRGDLLFGAFE
jgi:hypothetical protein